MKTKQLIKAFSNFLSTAGFCIFLTSLSTDRLMAFPVPVGAGFTFTSDDLSVKIGPYKLDLFKRDPKTGVIIEEYHEDIGPGGKVLDSKKKDGKFTIDSIKGDPLAILSGPINTGSGTIEIISPDSPNLFPSVTVNISLVSGFLEAGITLPGDQLSGPDGNDTFINYTTTWQSFEPVGRIIENGNEYDIVLGTFQLNSFGRPSSFFYTISPDGSIDSTFTQGETLSFLSSSPINGGDNIGTVTKHLTATPVPEPTSTLSLLALGTLGAASTLKRKLKSSKSSEKGTTKVS